jgi:rubredoxin
MTAAMTDLNQWQCGSCNFTYDEAQGWPQEGIAPGTRWEAVPQDWRCPDCSSSKEDFEPVEFTPCHPST